MEKLPSVISLLTTSRQQVDTLEKEVAGRARENLLLRHQLHEMTDFAEGLLVTMPADWSLEEQNTALRVTLRMVREDWPRVDDVQRLEIPGERDLSSFVRLVMAENEEQGIIVRKLERRILNLDMKIETFNINKVKEDEKKSGSAESFVTSEEEEAEVTLAMDTKAVGNAGNVSTSRAKLRKGRKKTSPKPYTQLRSGEEMINPSNIFNKSVQSLTDDQFCDMQIRMLEAGQELSKKDMLLVEEMTSKETDDLRMDRYAEEEIILQPCQVTMAGLGWGPPPVAVVWYMREYQGVSMVRVEGDKAIIQFSNLEWATKFRGEGGSRMVEGFNVEVGVVEMIKSEKMVNREEEDVVESSVAKAVRRRVRGSVKNAGLLN